MLHNQWCADRVGATSIRWPNSGQEVVEVCSSETKGLLDSLIGTCHEEGCQQHTSGQILAANGEEEESHHAIGSILHMQIGEGK
jgi:hypothetical protein